MEVTLYNNSSDNNVLSKSLATIGSTNVSLKGGSSTINPRFTLQISGESIKNANYFYIPYFGRYYFLTEKVAMRESLYELAGHVDVLMTFAGAIKATPAILSASATLGSNYISGAPWVRNCKNKTDIVTFPSGLLDSGEYILITAGG